MKLKVCGMKYLENIQVVAALQPDYLGFIFCEKSKRNFDGIIPELPNNIKKTGVFVNESIKSIQAKVSKYDLDAIQLHGDETVDYISKLKRELNAQIEIIKVFGIKDQFDFEIVQAYEEVVDYFLFDTKGKERGGNGITFDWTVLKNYSSPKPFFLSGGIGLEQVKEIQEIRKSNLPIYALDVNSQFEIKAGLKSVERIRKFKSLLVES
jgi:phosphoribosylanthranilate isomerase